MTTSQSKQTYQYMTSLMTTRLLKLSTTHQQYRLSSLKV